MRKKKAIRAILSVVILLTMVAVAGGANAVSPPKPSIPTARFPLP
jgi:hypothetical protein